MATIARNFNVGVEISELGLNKFSATLYDTQPELFETKEDIVVHPETGRTLSLYAMLSAPLAFNLHPVSGTDFEEGTLYCEAGLKFTLTDKENEDDPGKVITRIAMRLQCELYLDDEVTVSEQQINVYIKDINFTEFTADHPDMPCLPPPSGRHNLVVISEDMPSTDPSFIALLNYIIDAFLIDTLKKPVEEYPVPPINLVPDTDVNLYMRNSNIWGNTLGTYLHLQPGPLLPLSGSAPSHGKDISIGLTESVITSVLNNTLPVRSPIPATPSHTTFSIGGGSWIELKRRTGPFRSKIDLRPPDAVRATLFFNARINGRINIKLGKYWVRVGLPLPIGDPSFISGAFNFLVQNNEDDIEVKLRAGRSFFSDTGAIVIVTDYRGLIRRAVRDWLRGNVSPILRRIPIIGWIISKGVEEIISKLLGLFLGGALDAMVSTFLTVVLTSLYNIVRLGWNDTLEFKTFSVDKLPFGEDVPVRLNSLEKPYVENNGGGELVVHGTFDEPGIEVPDPPVPEQPEPIFVNATSDDDDDNRFDDADFQPPFGFPQLGWTSPSEVEYAMELTMDDIIFNGAQSIKYEIDTSNNTLIINAETVSNNAIAGGSSSSLFLDATSFQVHSEYHSTIIDTPNGSLEVITLIEYDYANNIARFESRYDGRVTATHNIPIPTETVIFGSVLGCYQLQGQLLANTEGKAARLDFDEATEIPFLAPVAITVSEKTSVIIEGVEIPVFKVTLNDNDYDTTAIVEANPMHRLLSMSQRSEGLTINLRLS
ncbi:hypothetical protein A9263_04640 [Vibrio cyclitrophicus]|uniref:hypothetical protein n=1 Tax=Vibrio cyclitrophicus TaxID=47951 RepID=UPI0007EECBFF|nr:hypothetical protein [Vibrio cyclitrophicus]OBT29350.1 hypothetical protein A9263_04640 [Vibrio cyclitrophicus]